MIETGWTSRPATAVFAMAAVRAPLETDIAQVTRVQPPGAAAQGAASGDRRTAAPVIVHLPEDHVAPPSAMQLRIISWLDQQAAEQAEKTDSAHQQEPGPETPEPARPDTSVRPVQDPPEPKETPPETRMDRTESDEG